MPSATPPLPAMMQTRIPLKASNPQTNQRTESTMTSSNRPYMLDTTVFNDLLDGKLSFEFLANHRLLVTGIQADELHRTSDPKRRAKLFATYEVVNPSKVLAASFALDIEGAGLDQAYWNDGSGKFEKMLYRLRELDSGKSNLNQLRDILIAETAIKNNAILITRDRNLRQVVSEFGGWAIDLAQL
jgi:predicted nucleic acid-binding protein